jgi:hypothetical protein
MYFQRLDGKLQFPPAVLLAVNLSQNRFVSLTLPAQFAKDYDGFDD